MSSPWIDLSDPGRVEAWLPLPFQQLGDQCALRDGLLIFGWRRVLEARPKGSFETDTDEVGAASIDLTGTPAVLSRQLPVLLPAQKSDVRGRKRWFELLLPDWEGHVVFHLEDPWSGPGSFGSRNFLFAFDPAGLRSPDYPWSVVRRTPDGRVDRSAFSGDLRELDPDDNLGWGSLVAWKSKSGELQTNVSKAAGFLSSDEEDREDEEKADATSTVAERAWDAREPARSLAADKAEADLWFLRPRTGRAPWPWPVTRIAGLQAFVLSLDVRLKALERIPEIVEAVPLDPDDGRIVLFVRLRDAKGPAGDAALIVRA